MLVGMDGHGLKRMREQLGLTQGELARRLGVYQSTISAWEGGARGIRHPEVLRLALRYLLAVQAGYLVEPDALVKEANDG